MVDPLATVQNFQRRRTGRLVSHCWMNVQYQYEFSFLTLEMPFLRFDQLPTPHAQN
jgi:hypothetical protein